MMTPFIAAVSALLVGFVLGIALAEAALDRMQRGLWQLLRWARGKPREVWRVGRRPWRFELAKTPLPLVPCGCANCDYWDEASGHGYASQLHSAMDHVWNTGDGLRNGQDEPDAWMSATTSAAVVIWRSQAGALLHRVFLDEEAAKQAVDLRWLLHDAPHLDAQCRECRNNAVGRGLDEGRTLPSNGAAYCRKWGVWLQEVLLPRHCPGSLRVASAELPEQAFPQWAQQLATDVVLTCYRRQEAPTARASWRDLWALMQERRLRRLLRRLLRERKAK
jgi:hypothetical protein